MSTPPRPARGRPASRSRPSGPGASRSRDDAAARDGRGGVAERERPRATTRRPAPDRRAGDGNGLDRLRILLASTMGAVLAGYTLLVPVAALIAGTGGVPVTADAALATAVPMWLAAHQIPIALDGRPLGVLPLLPTLVIVAVVAWFSRWAVRRLGGRVRHDAGAVVAAQAGAAAAVAVLAGALLPKEMAVTAPWASLLGAGLIGGAAAGAGVVHACGMPAAWKRVLAGWPGAALAGVRVAATSLLLTGALVLTGALLLTATAVSDAAARLGPGIGAGFGVLVLAVGYLPNALVGAVSWMLGAGVSVGVATSGPLLAEPGPLPAFPLTALLPMTTVPPAAPLVLLLPVLAGVLTGLACRRALADGAPMAERAAALATAAVVVAIGAGALATVAGGPLAGGPYDPVSFHPGAVFGAVLLLVGLPALLTCAGPELARHVPMGGPAGGRAGRAPGTGSRAVRRERSSTVADLVEGRRRSGASSRSGGSAGRDGRVRREGRRDPAGAVGDGAARVGDAPHDHPDHEGPGDPGTADHDGPADHADHDGPDPDPDHDDPGPDPGPDRDGPRRGSRGDDRDPTG
ncbi:putative integral membrane protein [Pseudonocardia sp. Ae168_Ps1]|uniref:cell division protein PerM n=1 Tax=unclassified Pseudonocardia TaxID=2619320 RepID=UPI00094B0404|nr:MULTISPECIES: DUF6350 family protein [unclassified Pseudonocardia]OLL74048.1 putative integral membrane protein [Pseudonocardia sp. Ae150A_Ps1]OLL80025.1 putative integral membrane protein [Pseudonocardia sp. Ae168_Ps1]OLL85843.1 putative integral membrane protein [Pseudonocardia sp. Ae263_Ps1]OLL94127.1 putative integral membrane protein [Pseudonocardia sp. Ae356_Ps1]